MIPLSPKQSDDTYLPYLLKENYQVSAYGNKGIAEKGARATIWFKRRQHA